MNKPQTDSPDIHPTALVHPQARLGSNVTVGAYSVIGQDVELGDDCEVMNHVTLVGPTIMGKRNRIFPYASIGQDPQDKKFDGTGESRLEVGDDNTIREFVTLNRGTSQDRGVTRIGNRNWIMAYCHVAHDCLLGDDVVMSNGSTLGGHVNIGDKATLGGFTAIHQFCTVGQLVMTGGQTMIAQDVPPFTIAVGNRAKLFGINKVGLERNGYSKEDIRKLQSGYRTFFKGKLGAEEALKKLEAEFGDSEAVMELAAFIRNSERGVCR